MTPVAGTTTATTGRPMRHPLLPLLLLTSPLAGQSPTSIRGEWLDDYGSRHRITDSTWQHHSNLYRIVRHEAEAGFVVAWQDRGDSTPSWTRIDLIRLDSMPPWRWGFCLTTWTAPSADSAAATTPADRQHPRTGCGGFPFTRMKEASSSLDQ